MACWVADTLLPFTAEDRFMKHAPSLRPVRALSVLSAVILLATPAGAEDQRLEADDVYTWGNLGGITIQKVSCDGALNGRAIDGLDVPGEWIQWHLTLTEPFCFVDSLHSAGTTGVIREFVTEYIPDPPAGTAARDTVFTVPGSGVG